MEYRGLYKRQLRRGQKSLDDDKGFNRHAGIIKPDDRVTPEHCDYLLNILEQDGSVPSRPPTKAESGEPSERVASLFDRDMMQQKEDKKPDYRDVKTAKHDEKATNKLRDRLSEEYEKKRSMLQQRPVNTESPLFDVDMMQSNNDNKRGYQTKTSEMDWKRMRSLPESSTGPKTYQSRKVLETKMDDNSLDEVRDAGKQERERAFQVLYGKYKPYKKVKDWTHDGFAKITDNVLALYDMTGKKIGRTEKGDIRTQRFESGTEIVVGGWECQIDAEIDVKLFDSRSFFATE